MNERRASGTVSPAGDVAARENGSGSPNTVPPARTAVRPSGWTGGRIVTLVIGAILIVVSVGLLSAGGVALWLDLTQRDAAGYITSGAHEFSTDGAALVTVPAELDSPGVGWLYSSVVLGNVRIRATPVNSDAPIFLGIGPADQVDGYVNGVSHTIISDFWSERVQTVSGDTPASSPGTQGFWGASANGSGAQAVTWDAANGSWSVVAMNADGRPGLEVRVDLGATFPALLGLAVGSLVFGGLFMIGGVLLIVGVLRRRRVSRAVAV